MLNRVHIEIIVIIGIYFSQLPSISQLQIFEECSFSGFVYTYNLMCDIRLVS